jgi:hypothetical protein
LHQLIEETEKVKTQTKTMKVVEEDVKEDEEGDDDDDIDGQVTNLGEMSCCLKSRRTFGYIV